HPDQHAYPKTVLRLHWSTKPEVQPIDRNMEIAMPDMELEDIVPGICNGTYATGEWSCLTAIFQVQRKMLHHVMQVYVPTSLIVIISWFSFWLPVDSAPARVSLSITTLLTISTQANAVKLALPEVSYMKVSNFFFIIIALEEFDWYDNLIALCVKEYCYRVIGPIKSFWKNDDELGLSLSPQLRNNNDDHIALKMLNIEMTEEPRLRSLQPQNSHELVGNGVGHRTIIGVDRIKRKRSRQSMNKLRKQTIEVSRRALNWTRSLRHLHGRRIAQRIDERCRILFPIFFLFFNFCYWGFYLVIA
ncbi:hypothetical protein WR25_09269, partial [Diploscapter pachys]